MATGGAVDKGSKKHAGRAIVVADMPAALRELADQADAQMIVVGSYGDRPLKGALLGSTAHKRLHLAERPVLVLRAATA